MLSNYPLLAISFMSQAFEMAALSSARRRKTGAGVYRQLEGKYFQPVSNGINGTRTGTPNYCENIEGTSRGRKVIHAEQNCLIKMMTTGVATEGCTLVTTFVPCEVCCESIIDAKIREVVYCEDSINESKKASIGKLEEVGIRVHRVTKHEVIEYKMMVLDGLRTGNKFLGEPVEQEYLDFANHLKSLTTEQVELVKQNIENTIHQRNYSPTKTFALDTNIIELSQVTNGEDLLQWFENSYDYLMEIEHRVSTTHPMMRIATSLPDLLTYYVKIK